MIRIDAPFSVTSTPENQRELDLRQEWEDALEAVYAAMKRLDAARAAFLPGQGRPLIDVLADVDG